MRDATITINNGAEIEIIGSGKITSGTNNINTITNYGILNVKDSVTIEQQATISSSYAAIYNGSNSYNGITNIQDDALISGYYKGIYNYYGIVNIDGGKVEATYLTNGAYGLDNDYNNSSRYGVCNINGGEIAGYSGVYNSIYSKLHINGGTIKGIRLYGVYVRGETNIYGGSIIGDTYGIYGYNTDVLTIGKSEEILNTTEPSIRGVTYGIYMYKAEYSFNFYNGVIKHNAKEKVYIGTINIREEHMIYTFFDDETDNNYHTILIPQVTEITMDYMPKTWTNQNVKVTITYPDSLNNVNQYSVDGELWTTINSNNVEFYVEKTCTVYARTLDENEMVIDNKQLAITNIDKLPPVVEVKGNDLEELKTTYIVMETDETVDINFILNVSDTGGSGLDEVQYAFARDGENLVYIDFTDETIVNKTNLGIGTYRLYLKVSDIAENRAELTEMRFTIKYQEPVAQIVDTKYLTVQEAIDACTIYEEGEEQEQTIIQILCDTDEEFEIFDGQNIIIDLQGYKIGSSNINMPICNNGGTLKIENGMLESLNGIAIINNGTLTLGDNDNTIDSINPIIYGRKIGIQNNYIFNMYDGKIQGITPISGNVQDTPEEYTPVETDHSNGITTVQLGVVIDNWVARRGWIYYTSVQEAVNATKTNINKSVMDTVTIIKDVQMDDTLSIANIKNVILDLNGITLTVKTTRNTIINNDGNLVIKDTSIEQTGIMKIDTTSTSYGIYNSGNITFEGGTINSRSQNSKTNSYGIYNENNGSVQITGGTIYSELKGNNYSRNEQHCSYGIYNNSIGEIKISGGTVSSQSWNYDSYGVYNNDSGRIEISGGTVVSNGSSCIRHL